MKKYLFMLIAASILIFNNYSAQSQESNNIPSVKVKSLIGDLVDTKDFNNNGLPFIISFWATWCKPCLLEMKNISDLYEDWQKETGVKIISISIDDSRNSKKVAPLVKGKNWKFEFYLDENSDFKRAMNVNSPPHTFLCNGKGEIVWQHTGYAEGDEDELIAKVRELIKTEKNKDNNEQK